MARVNEFLILFRFNRDARLSFGTLRPNPGKSGLAITARFDFYSKRSPDGNTIAVRPGPITYVYIYRGDYEHRTRISQQENMPVHYFQNLYYIITGVDCTIPVMV